VSLSGLERKRGRRNGIHTVYVNFTVELGLAPASNERANAFLGETFSGAKANAGTAACNDCYFVSSFLFINWAVAPSGQASIEHILYIGDVRRICPKHFFEVETGQTKFHRQRKNIDRLGRVVTKQVSTEKATSLVFDENFVESVLLPDPARGRPARSRSAIGVEAQA
jgi:hypothetical protein